MSVLVIDDDEQVLRAHKRILEGSGLDVVAVDGGFAAFVALDARQFGAVVCDHKMPDLDGKSFYEQLEEFYPNLASRVVFVTGCAGEPDVSSFLRATGQPVLQKPVETAELIRVVKEMESRPN